MAKFGRNSPCPCGSGKKFKKCHGHPANTTPHRISPEELQQLSRRMEAAEVQRQKQQGLGRGIVSTVFKGFRIVAVGSVLHYSPNWKTFHDFLRYFLVACLGSEWFESEQVKAVAFQHPIVRWYTLSNEAARQHAREMHGILSGPATGAQRAFLNLAYNLYLIAHHSPPDEADAILSRFLKRLKSERSDAFIGVLFETYASAAFLKAGFQVDFENERDGTTSHVEFTATYPKTGRSFSVEVKSRSRSPAEDGKIDDVKRLRVASKLNRALQKNAAHDRVVFIEVNIPDVLGQELNGWAQAALEQVRYAEAAGAPDGVSKPSAYVFITNHAFHNNIEGMDVGVQVLSCGCNIPDYGPDVPFHRFKDVLAAEERHIEMFALMDSIRSHQSIPITFDGEISQFAFGHADSASRMLIGNHYLVPVEDGTEQPGRLTQAIVLENKKQAFCVMQLINGENIIVTVPMTDAEVDAWRSHPDTFFGEVKEVQQEAKNWIEMARFFYQSYRNTPRDRLLEFMSNHSDYHELVSLPQNELSIIYCERLAWAAERHGRRANGDPTKAT